VKEFAAEATARCEPSELKRNLKKRDDYFRELERKWTKDLLPPKTSN
jgi:hypothetical protein